MEHAGDASQDDVESTTSAHDKVWRTHLALAVGLALCAVAFWFELHRALGGNELSWAYVFEWPLFIGYGIYMWRRLVVDEQRRASGLAPAVRARRAPRRASAVARVERRAAQESAALDAWNAYLAETHPLDRRPGKSG